MDSRVQRRRECEKAMKGLAECQVQAKKAVPRTKLEVKSSMSAAITNSRAKTIKAVSEGIMKH